MIRLSDITLFVSLVFLLLSCDTFNRYNIRPSSDYEILPTGQEGISFEVKDKKIIIDLDISAFNSTISANLKIKNTGITQYIFKPFESQLIETVNNKIQNPENVWTMDTFVSNYRSRVSISKDTYVLINPGKEYFFHLNIGRQEFSERLFSKNKPYAYLFLLKLTDSESKEISIKSDVSMSVR